MVIASMTLDVCREHYVLSAPVDYLWLVHQWILGKVSDGSFLHLAKEFGKSGLENAHYLIHDMRACDI